MSSTSTETSTTTETSTDGSDKEWDVLEMVVSNVIVDYTHKNFIKRPYRNDKLSGKEYMNNVLGGNVKRSVDMFRMGADMLYDLCALLRSRGVLDDTRYVSLEEQVCIFLYTIGHNDSNRTVADRFQHSGETISRHFGKVLKAICRVSNELITPPDMSVIHSYIKSKGDKYYPWFKNCVGAIDGTHISAAVPSGKYQIPYRGRKISPTQNVMCACDFDMCFTFVLAGWEGTANDSRILNEAVSNANLKFPQPPQGKYYVVDSGYANALGFLAPYKGERYHLKDYAGKGHARAPKTAKEKFNFAHSSLRNKIERCFGVLKAHFPILKMMPPYSLRKQCNLVIACCALHNFIRRYGVVDTISKPYEKDDLIIDSEGNMITPPSFINIDGNRVQEMNRIRDEICKMMGRRYRLPV